MPDPSASRFHIAICCNAKMLPGLHATVGSLVRMLGERENVALTLFWQDLSPAERATIRGTIEDAGGIGALEFRPADTSQFSDLPALHGDRMTYLRLLLPHLLPGAETILYLDSDLVVAMDVAEFFREPIGSHPVAAVEGTTVALSFDHAFLRQVGLRDDDRYFNCGVLLIQAAHWRRDGISERALAFAREHASDLPSHDQSVLVALFSRDFARLPRHFNRGLSPLREPLAETGGIYHFVGSPKPWDPFGRFVHGNWKLWNSAATTTRFHRWSYVAKHGGMLLRRAWNLRRSYLRTLLRPRRRALPRRNANNI